MTKRINSKQKGSAFEREVVDIFKRTFGEGFMRTPHSGAQFGKSNRFRMEGIDEGFSHQMTGDLVVPKGFPLSIECKSYKDFEFHQVLQGENKVLDGWIEQAESDAEVSGKQMLLVMKFVRKGAYICSDNFSIYDNEQRLDEQLDNVIWYKGKYIIYTLEDFLRCSNIIDVIRNYIINKK